MLGFILDVFDRRVRVLSVVTLGGMLAATGALACPDWRQTGREIRYSAEQLWSPQSLSVVAGGSANLANCPQPGRGYVATRPDFDLTLTENNRGRDLEFRVTASCDTVLLINGANGQWSFNDDSNGFNPRIRLPNAEAGIYDIWVGTYGPSTCQATLTLETFGGSVSPPPPPPPPPVALCPDPGQNGQMLTYDAGQLWQAQRFGVVAGGSVDLGACSSVPGHGRVVQRPDFTLNLTGNSQAYDLEFRVEASCDPVLLVNGANGQWHYNDDADGLNSRLRIPRAQPGLYDVWVGTFGQSTCQATLIAETFGGQVTPPPPPPPPPQPPVFGGMPAAAGEWSITGNGHQGYLRLDWGPNGWSGIVMYGGGGVETLQDLRFDPVTGSIEFTRPLGSNTQHYRGQLVGTEMRGSFNQGGADYRYNWHATLRQAQTGTVSPQPPAAATNPAAAGTARFVLVETGRQLTFDEARREAEALGGHLATITSHAEMEALRAVLAGRDVFSSSAGPWLGGVRTGTGSAADGWTWITGEPWGFTAWARNEPNYFRDAQLTSLTLTHRDGISWNDDAPYAPVTSFIVEFPGVPLAGAGPVGTPGGAMPAAAGIWQINGNNYPGTLTLTWSGTGWSGVVNYLAHSRDEPLENIRFDPVSGSIEFTRPIPGATQIYHGVLAGGEMRGEFNQAGGGYNYRWIARLTEAQAPMAPAPAAPPTGGATK